MLLDTLITGASVITMDPDRPSAHTIGIWNGQIAGLDEDVAHLPARRVIDLGGATILPGFVDAHSHLAWTGLAARAVNIAPCDDLETVLATLAQAVAKTPVGSWVEAIGYDQRALGRHLTRTDLDRVSDGRLVHLIHVSGHAAVVSSEVIERFPHQARSGAEGVELDEQGELTGLLLEEGTRFVSELRTPYEPAVLDEALQEAARICAAEGVTTCAEAGVGGTVTGASQTAIADYQRAHTAGLPLRTQLMVVADRLHTLPAHPDDDAHLGLDLGVRTGIGDARLSVGAMKLWLDGGMMARTAALSEPYEGTGDRGLLAHDTKTVTETICKAHASGWQLALHAIGDRAIDVALDALEQAQREHPRADARHRIEHCGLVRPDQLARLAELDVTAVIQPTFLHEFGDDYAQIMGPERAEWMYRGRSLLAQGVRVAGSSDRPVSCGAPLGAIQFMVERRSRSGALIGAAEGITVDEALAAYTRDAAYACRLDHLVGSITSGKRADLAVLAQDPRSVPVPEISGIKILATVFDGETVHGELGSAEAKEGIK
ncbi:amidohydrolase [Streptomyces sp. RS2]|uniref:amidohydrolase n=1 Tax=Streptomyces sp. RS2 TaxID=1451205 RepID=UPI0021F8B372|nr:amidohydrolase [Streptomyces sp. RS2]MCW1100188.1 amidohydrolase [Streptomyces sp. RS2]